MQTLEGVPLDFWPETMFYIFRGKKQKHYFILGKEALLNGELIIFPLKQCTLESSWACDAQEGAKCGVALSLKVALV